MGRAVGADFDNQIQRNKYHRPTSQFVT